MNFTGRVEAVSRDWQSSRLRITFTVNERAAETEIDSIKDAEILDIKAVKHRKKRSLDANALLWHCLGEMAASLGVDKWGVYLAMLKRYGKYTYICVKPHVVDAVRQQWRETEVVGEVDINGQRAIQMLCYFGSSTYDSKEFSVLLDGVVSEMREMGLEPPLPQDLKEAIETYEKHHTKP